jgi:hypothetical protein
MRGQAESKSWWAAGTIGISMRNQYQTTTYNAPIEAIYTWNWTIIHNNQLERNWIAQHCLLGIPWQINIWVWRSSWLFCHICHVYCLVVANPGEAFSLHRIPLILWVTSIWARTPCSGYIRDEAWIMWIVPNKFSPSSHQNTQNNFLTFQHSEEFFPLWFTQSTWSSSLFNGTASSLHPFICTAYDIVHALLP